MKAGARILPFLLLAVLSLLLLPAAGWAAVRIGVLMSGDIPYYREMHEAFTRELQQTPGGESVEFILQRPFPDAIAWSNAARKLIAVDVDLIVAYGTPAALAVVEEKSKIPVVYAGVYDPENAGIKGGHVTGCGFRVPLSSILRHFKRLKNVDSLTVLYSGIEPQSVRQKEELLTLAEGQKVKVESVDLRVKADLEQLSSRPDHDTVLITGSALVHLWLGDIVSILRQNKAAVASIFPDSEGAGVLITLFHPPQDQGRTAAGLAARILKGEEAVAIAPVVLRETELVFNLPAAQQIDITFPVQMVVEATRVVK